MLGVVVAITWPEIEMAPLFVAFGVGALVLPILLYPSSYTMWQGVDILMRPPQPEDFDPIDDPATASTDASTSRPPQH